MTEMRLRELLDALPACRIAVVGDFFVDKYLLIDPDLEEISIETGLAAHQVVEVRCQPGAAGTVTNNLAALGVGTLHAVGLRGDDGDGYELERGLRAGRVGCERLFPVADRRTPTYTKPLMIQPDGPPAELNRLDIKNLDPTPTTLEDRVMDALDELAGEVDAIIVADQVEEPNCGVITSRVRAKLAQMGEQRPDLPILADSRAALGAFRGVILKPNLNEAGRALEISDADDVAAPGEDPLRAVPEEWARLLAAHTGRPAYITLGEDGVVWSDGDAAGHVPGVEVTEPIDIVGAGDSFCAGAACGLASGATLAEAAQLGCLVASITVQQLGTTGTASPQQVLARLAESPYAEA